MPLFSAHDLAAWTRGQWIGARPQTATGISIDTRTLKPGQIYLALKGERFDGHTFVNRAHELGAAACIVQSPMEGAGSQLVVQDTHVALTDLARGHRAQLQTEFIAVTGSIGKTTVKELMADALSMMAPTARSRGNFNNNIGLPLCMLDVDATSRFGVLELGMNHPGELAPLCDLLRPSVGIVTTIGPVHIEFFESVEGIAREKASVLASLPRDGLAVLCRDDAYFDVLRSYASCEILTTSLKGEADYVARRGSGLVFSVRENATGQKVDIVAPLPGEYFVQDALYAIAVARRRGLSWAAISDAIRNFHPISMRWQTQRIHGVDVINDGYNANPVSMRAALQAFSEVHAQKRKWLVIAGMRELGEREAIEHEELGRDIARGLWAGLVALGDRAVRVGNAASAAGFKGKVLCCATHADAAAFLHEELVAGDAVLLKGSRGEHVEYVLAEWEKLTAKEAANHE